MSQVPFDRSRVVAVEDCWRKRWWLYEWQGRGLQPVRRFVALEAGGAIHEGLALLAQGHPLDGAIERALKIFRTELDAADIDMTLYEGQEPSKVVAEHEALIEALLRAFAATVLPKLLADYEVVGIEEESYVDFHAKGIDLRLLARVDGLLRRRVDNALFVLSYKTASMLGKKWRDTMETDQQVVTELMAADAALARAGSSERVQGVIIIGLAKGRRQEYPEGSGNWYHNSPLIWGWRLQGEPPMRPDQWATRYVGIDGKRLGKGWRKASIWDNYRGGVSGWIGYLRNMDPELLAEQFVMLPPVRRDEAAVQEWKDSVLPREATMPLRAGAVKDEHDLAELFPKHTSDGNCVWPSKCACYELCHGAVGADPLGSGLFEMRDANHPAEAAMRWELEDI